MGLEVDNSNDELMEDHSQELATKDLTELPCFSQKKIGREMFVREGEGNSKAKSSSAMREMLKAWGIVASYIDKHHLKKTVVMRATNLLNDNAASHYRQILKGQKRQIYLNSFLVKKNDVMYHKKLIISIFFLLNEFTF
ncbi:hypothetical protein AVEN_216835-1 [Araneus ventricosus]|uniref:Uncharacterized protein n=1 Tax=Araneus ventricosus TaxID=182803 RepID=A0A4Y2JIG6_ARAVE|nr:hypothetical protein AVEN_216835-1 [Araneus ventricosus]